MNSTQKTTLYVMLFLLPALFSQSHSETYGQETNYPRRGTSAGDGIYWEIPDGGVWGAHESWRILTYERHGTITVYGLYSISFYNATETKLSIEFSVRFLDPSGKEIAEPSTHSGSPTTLDAGELITFPDVPFSAEFLTLTEVEKLDVVTVFASFDSVDDLSVITRVSDYTILGGVPDTFALLPCYPNPVQRHDYHPVWTCQRMHAFVCRYSMPPARRPRHCLVSTRLLEPTRQFSPAIATPPEFTSLTLRRTSLPQRERSC